MKISLILIGFAIVLLAYGQAMYKYPDPSETVAFLTDARTPQEGGEAVQALLESALDRAQTGSTPGFLQPQSVPQP